MTTYYKAIEPDGTDFYSGTVQWAPAKTKARKGRVVKHPTSTKLVAGDWSTGLAASTDVTRFPGADPWPIRLLEVEPVGTVHHVGAKAQALAWSVVAELDPALRFGPQGAHIVALIERAGLLTADEASRLHAARNAARNAAGVAARNAAWDAAWNAAGDAARNAAWDAAGDAARNAAWDAAWNAAWNAAGDAAWVAAWDAAWVAAWDAAQGLVVRDLIGRARYDTLTGPWRKVVGPIHPDDADLRSAP